MICQSQFKSQATVSFDGENDSSLRLLAEKIEVKRVIPMLLLFRAKCIQQDPEWMTDSEKQHRRCKYKTSLLHSSSLSKLNLDVEHLKRRNLADLITKNNRIQMRSWLICVCIKLPLLIRVKLLRRVQDLCVRMTLFNYLVN